MLKLIIIVITFGVLAFSLSIYKNKTISAELSKELNTIKVLDHKELSCDGLFKSECIIKEPTFKGVLIADSLTIKDIDPTLLPKKGDFIEIPISFELKNTKYSIWDALSKQESSPQMQDFLKKYSGDYDISSTLSIVTDGSKIKSLKLFELKADDKFLPFFLSAKVDGLDSMVILESLYSSFDFSKKRIIFDDFVDSMKKCCIDDFPPEYKNMSNDELYKKFIEKLQENDFKISSLNQAIAVISDKDKNNLDLSLKAKTKTPIKKMILPFLMGGTAVVEQFFDINVEAK